MQIIKETVEDIRKESLQYTKVTSCKFVLAVNPKETPNPTFVLELKDIKEGTLHVLAVGMTSKGVFIKLKAILHTSNMPSHRHG